MEILSPTASCNESVHQASGHSLFGSYSLSDQVSEGVGYASPTHPIESLGDTRPNEDRIGTLPPHKGLIHRAVLSLYSQIHARQLSSELGQYCVCVSAGSITAAGTTDLLATRTVSSASGRHQAGAPTHVLSQRPVVNAAQGLSLIDSAREMHVLGSSVLSVSDPMLVVISVTHIPPEVGADPVCGRLVYVDGGEVSLSVLERSLTMCGTSGPGSDGTVGTGVGAEQQTAKASGDGGCEGQVSVAKGVRGGGLTISIPDDMESPPAALSDRTWPRPAADTDTETGTQGEGDGDTGGPVVSRVKTGAVEVSEGDAGEGGIAEVHDGEKREDADMAQEGEESPVQSAAFQLPPALSSLPPIASLLGGLVCATSRPSRTCGRRDRGEAGPSASCAGCQCLDAVAGTSTLASVCIPLMRHPSYSCLILLDIETQGGRAETLTASVLHSLSALSTSTLCPTHTHRQGSKTQGMPRSSEVVSLQAALSDCQRVCGLWQHRTRRAEGQGAAASPASRGGDESSRSLSDVEGECAMLRRYATSLERRLEDREAFLTRCALPPPPPSAMHGLICTATGHPSVDSEAASAAACYMSADTQLELYRVVEELRLSRQSQRDMGDSLAAVRHMADRGTAQLMAQAQADRQSAAEAQATILHLGRQMAQLERECTAARMHLHTAQVKGACALSSAQARVAHLDALSERLTAARYAADRDAELARSEADRLRGRLNQMQTQLQNSAFSALSAKIGANEASLSERGVLSAQVAQAEAKQHSMQSVVNATKQTTHAGISGIRDVLLACLEAQRSARQEAEGLEDSKDSTHSDKGSQTDREARTPRSVSPPPTPSILQGLLSGNPLSPLSPSGIGHSQPGGASIVSGGGVRVPLGGRHRARESPSAHSLSPGTPSTHPGGGMLTGLDGSGGRTMRLRRLKEARRMRERLGDRPQAREPEDTPSPKAQ
ncbi:hypothetical protein KIPB_001347 [Kipferlia bialata]|uniref:Uncharacterized protein n=1 Tax=Kipferlia bialata TaxID=797122 RepID=A0A9K3GF48_9EUKA|nr:hypothetical protein KIPB_000482 [Kipferlia bialata]GIQ80533.1 hypothetical protein KIPB_001347 [Kipferlia bialata]|eukprot:g482.t1